MTAARGPAFGADYHQLLRGAKLAMMPDLLSPHFDPLKHDSDASALLLAVAFAKNLHVHIFGKCVRVGGSVEFFHQHAGDKSQALRYAITRAATE